MNNHIVLIRRRLSPEALVALSGALREAVHTQASPMVFLHGDGVAALAGTGGNRPALEPGVDGCVCQTSLGRRSATGVLTAPFRVATLATFYQAVCSACRVDSLGLGGALCCRTDQVHRDGNSPIHLLLEVGFAPADWRQRRETLEMALGAAALELEATVLFHGEGLAHLAGDAARGWAQFTDFDLLNLYAEAPAHRFEQEIAVQTAVQTVDAADAARIRACAATILIL